MMLFVRSLFSAAIWSLVPLVVGLPTVTAASEQANGATGVFNCTIKPLPIVEVSSPISGIVKRVHVSPGDRVAPGDVLLELDSELAVIEMRAAEIRSNATADLTAAITRRDGLAAKEARLAKARKRGAVSEGDYEVAVTDLAISESDILKEQQRLQIAAVELERTRAVVAKSILHSPVAGVVGEDLIDPGEGAAGNKPVVTIYVNQPLRVEAFIAAQHLTRFVESEAFFVAINNEVDAQLELEFEYAAQVADLASNTISVFFKLSAPNILPGSKCIVSNSPSALIDRGF